MVKRRKSFDLSKPAVKPKSIGISIDRVEETISLDLALTELNDIDALERVNKIFTEKSSSKLQVLLRYLKFIKKKTVLLQAVELLKNKSVALSVRTPDHKIVRTVRICDIAFVELSKRAETLNPKYDFLDSLSLPNFSDQELTQAYKKLKVIFEKEVLSPKTESTPVH